MEISEGRLEEVETVDGADGDTSAQAEAMMVGGQADTEVVGGATLRMVLDSEQEVSLPSGISRVRQHPVPVSSIESSQLLEKLSSIQPAYDDPVESNRNILSVLRVCTLLETIYITNVVLWSN